MLNWKIQDQRLRLFNFVDVVDEASMQMERKQITSLNLRVYNFNFYNGDAKFAHKLMQKNCLNMDLCYVKVSCIAENRKEKN